MNSLDQLKIMQPYYFIINLIAVDSFIENYNKGKKNICK